MAAVWTAILTAAVFLAGCGMTGGESETPVETQQTAEEETLEDTEALLENAGLTGSIADCTEEGAHVVETQIEGDVAVAPAPGYETEAAAVRYQDGMEIERISLQTDGTLLEGSRYPFLISSRVIRFMHMETGRKMESFSRTE